MYFLVEEPDGAVDELVEKDLKLYEGDRVEVAGTKLQQVPRFPFSGRVFAPSQISRIEKGGCKPAKSQLKKVAGPQGMSAAAKIAIAVIAIGGGVGAAIALAGKGKRK